MVNDMVHHAHSNNVVEVTQPFADYKICVCDFIALLAHELGEISNAGPDLEYRAWNKRFSQCGLDQCRVRLMTLKTLGVLLCPMFLHVGFFECHASPLWPDGTYRKGVNGWKGKENKI